MSDPHDERALRQILDTSAVLSFTQRSIHVGEVLAQVADEDAVAGIPLICLLEASRSAADQGRLALLVEHRFTEVLAEDPAQWQALATLYDIVGRLDAASAALAALDYGVDVLTRQPGLYTVVDGGSMVIPIEK